MRNAIQFTVVQLCNLLYIDIVQCLTNQIRVLQHTSHRTEPHVHRRVWLVMRSDHCTCALHTRWGSTTTRLLTSGMQRLSFEMFWHLQHAPYYAPCCRRKCGSSHIDTICNCFALTFWNESVLDWLWTELLESNQKLVKLTNKSSKWGAECCYLKRTKQACRCTSIVMR